MRDATFTLYALITGSYIDEARAWRDWVLRTVASIPSQRNIMFSLGGDGG